MKLRKPCAHGLYDYHELPFSVNSNIEELRAVNRCPGGVFLPDDTLVIEKVDGEWPEWAVNAIYNGPYTEWPREILDALVREST